jgi:exodeoxyribonuclease VII small subunit
MAAARKTFEEELKELETLVAQLDSGQLSLEDSLKAFERGVSLMRSLNQRLDEAERKVEVLMRDAQGELHTTTQATPGGEPAEQKDDDVPF